MDTRREKALADAQLVTALLFGVLGTTLVLRIVKTAYDGEPIRSLYVGALLVCLVTGASVFLGDRVRRIVGWSYMAVMALSIPLFIFGAGLGNTWMQDHSVDFLFAGFPAMILLWPDSQRVNPSTVE
ncbi:MAG: hypothetical protein AAB478_05305 [Patescibacteria group bacterium]